MSRILKLALVPALIQVVLFSVAVQSRVPAKIISESIGIVKSMAPAMISASSSDHVSYVMSQGKCKEVTEDATRDCRWPAGLYPFVDQLVKGGRIIAYKIRWFNGSWSGWYVPGVNDIDGKFNPSSRSCSLPYLRNSMRRMWSYFYDHTHKYIICTH
ncbi:uncharacterized protein LOC121366732 [Gigantopelta aegis]|uniref:uncharacterized protein LOC121366732 n=1 Tax=Gigantopelta aegis TaxID=1735272 RepID=UPI001B888AF5|nr:uncharacterized protein LOC121366732 [Gigantopelta aegis]